MKDVRDHFHCFQPPATNRIIDQNYFADSKSHRINLRINLRFDS